MAPSRIHENSPLLVSYLVVNRLLALVRLYQVLFYHFCPHTSSTVHDTVESHNVHLVYISEQKHQVAEGLAPTYREQIVFLLDILSDLLIKGNNQHCMDVRECQN